MKILDCFPYFDEKELMELRIRLLRDVVDHFVICDANRTHHGDPKPFSAKKTLEELGLYSDKITVLEVTLPSREEVPDNWIRENLQRDALTSMVTDYDTVCIVTDTDEIMNPEFVKYYAGVASQNKKNILRIPMAFLNAKADLCVVDETGKDRAWASGFIGMRHHFDCYSPSKIRESYSRSRFNLKFPDAFQYDNGVNLSAGWHFSWMGGRDRMIRKWRSFADQNDNLPTAVGHGNKKAVELFISMYDPQEGSTDPIGRTDHCLRPYPVDSLPKIIFENKAIEDYMFPPEFRREPSYNKASDNITKKYGLKIFCDQFGHPVNEDFVDHSEIDCIKSFENLCLDLKSENKNKYSMIELGSNQAYYSMLFRAIIDGVGVNDRCTNILLEPTAEYMERGRLHFEKNGFDAIYDIGCIGHYWCWETRWHDNTLKSYTIDELMQKYDLPTLDVLHSDIDGNEIRLIETSDRAFRDRKIKYVVLLTHGAWNESDSTYSSKIINRGEDRHEVCKKFFLSCGYKLLVERPGGTVGYDGLLVFGAI